MNCPIVSLTLERIAAIAVSELEMRLDEAAAPAGAAVSLPAIAEYWLRVATERARPTRTDLKPEQMLPALQDMFLIDVMRTGGLRYRLVGTRLAGQFDRDPTTRLVGSAGDRWGDALFRPVVSEIGDTVTPTAFLAYARSRENDPPVFAAVGAPLYDDAGEPRMIVGAGVFGPVPAMTAQHVSRLVIMPLTQ